MLKSSGFDASLEIIWDLDWIKAKVVLKEIKKKTNAELHPNPMFNLLK
jgi:hypothetical protein